MNYYFKAYTLTLTVTNSRAAVIRRLQDVADPIASVMLILGFFLVMLGQKRRGLEVAKWVALAYIAIQWVPTIMGFIKDLARGV